MFQGSSYLQAEESTSIIDRAATQVCQLRILIIRRKVAAQTLQSEDISAIPKHIERDCVPRLFQMMRSLLIVK